MSTKLWQRICQDCSGGIDSLVELLQGRLSKGVMERLCRQGTGLFPKPSEIAFKCSCPDGASMCKHVAAVLYGIGARLDDEPGFLFRLRAVNESDLIANLDAALPLPKRSPAASRLLKQKDVSELFGLDMEAEENSVHVDVATPAQPKMVVEPKSSGPVTPKSEKGKSNRVRAISSEGSR